jgi:hypothetical protein
VLINLGTISTPTPYASGESLEVEDWWWGFDNDMVVYCKRVKILGRMLRLQQIEMSRERE